MSDELKLYGTRDHFAQGQHYIKHVMAMTEEGLHRKSDIAAELAHRDIQIEALRAAVASTLADLRVARAAQPQQAAECAQCATPHVCKRDGCFAKRVRAMMPLTAPVLMQDEPDGGRLSKALAGKPDAMQRAREAAAALNGASVLTDAEIGIATQYIAPASPTELHDYDLRVARAIEAAVIAKLGGAA